MAQLEISLVVCEVGALQSAARRPHAAGQLSNKQPRWNQQ